MRTLLGSFSPVVSLQGGFINNVDIRARKMFMNSLRLFMNSNAFSKKHTTLHSAVCDLERVIPLYYITMLGDKRCPKKHVLIKGIQKPMPRFSSK
jgi:hypothetical protein